MYQAPLREIRFVVRELLAGGGLEQAYADIDYSAELYHYYSTYLRHKLDTLPGGTRFVSYCSADDEMPLSYQLVKTHYDGKLKFWIKK